MARVLLDLYRLSTLTLTDKKLLTTHMFNLYNQGKVFSNYDFYFDTHTHYFYYVNLCFAIR